MIFSSRQSWQIASSKQKQQNATINTKMRIQVTRDNFFSCPDIRPSPDMISEGNTNDNNGSFGHQGNLPNSEQMRGKVQKQHITLRPEKKTVTQSSLITVCHSDLKVSWSEVTVQKHGNTSIENSFQWISS
jgi:hypothetical protein